MTAGVVIWSSVALLIAGIGVWAWNSKKAVAFFSGTKPPEVKDVKKYNHSVAALWFAYAALFAALGLPLMFLKKGSAAFAWSILGVPVISVMLAVCDSRVLRKHRRE